MSFGKLESRPAPLAYPEPFWPVFWASLVFCLTAPVIFGTLFNLASTGLELFMRSAWGGNWGHAPSLMDPLRELAARRPVEWVVRLAPAALCALMWCVVHTGRKHPAPAALFIPFAIFTPALLFLVTSPIWAYAFDRDAQGSLDLALAMLLASFISPFMIVISLSGFAYFFVKTGAWIHAIVSSGPGQAAIYIYLALVIATSFFALAVECYATWRNTLTTREAVRRAAYDFAKLVTSPVWFVIRLGGFTEKPSRTPTQSVAYAIAAPWAIPVFCMTVFAIANRSNYFFPLTAAFGATISYALAYGLWRAAELTGLTSYRITGAFLGFLIAFLVAIPPFVIDAQAETVRANLGSGQKLEILATTIPVFLALLVSLFRGLRAGWRAGRMETGYSYGR